MAMIFLTNGVIDNPLKIETNNPFLQLPKNENSTFVLSSDGSGKMNWISVKDAVKDVAVDLKDIKPNNYKIKIEVGANLISVSLIVFMFLYVLIYSIKDKISLSK